MRLDGDMLDNLYDVGVTKAVGYLPINTILNYTDETPAKLIAWANSEGLNWQRFSPSQCSIASGALFVYDSAWLARILDHYSISILPNQPYKFISRIARKTIDRDKYPEAYKIIGLTFNDYRWKYDDEKIRVDNLRPLCYYGCKQCSATRCEHSPTQQNKWRLSYV